MIYLEDKEMEERKGVIAEQFLPSSKILFRIKEIIIGK